MASPRSVLLSCALYITLALGMYILKYRFMLFILRRVKYGLGCSLWLRRGRSLALSSELVRCAALSATQLRKRYEMFRTA